MLLKNATIRLITLLNLILLCGCTGVWLPKRAGPSTDQSRVEMEFIPSAELVRENTAPRWALGRFAFQHGPNGLLVVSNITSFADELAEQAKKEVEPKRIDRILERLWVTIPLGTTVGETLRLEDLEARFLIGYDAGLIGDDQFVQPSRVSGTVRLTKESADHVVIDVDIFVQSTRYRPWRVKSQQRVPVTTVGLRGWPVREIDTVMMSTEEETVSDTDSE